MDLHGISGGLHRLPASKRAPCRRSEFQVAPAVASAGPAPAPVTAMVLTDPRAGHTPPPLQFPKRGRGTCPAERFSKCVCEPTTRHVAGRYFVSLDPHEAAAGTGLQRLPLFSPAASAVAGAALSPPWRLCPRTASATCGSQGFFFFSKGWLLLSMYRLVFLSFPR